MPDVTVNICLKPLGRVTDEHFAHASLIVVQYSLAIGAFIIEHPDKADDLDAQQLAGVEGALNAYRSMLAAEPDRKSPALEKLLALHASGQLPAFVRDAYRQCASNSGK